MYCIPLSFGLMTERANFCMCTVCAWLCMVSMQAGECIPCLWVSLKQWLFVNVSVSVSVIFYPKQLFHICVVSELVRGGKRMCGDETGICDSIPVPLWVPRWAKCCFPPSPWGPDQLERVRALPPPNPLSSPPPSPLPLFCLLSSPLCTLLLISSYIQIQLLIYAL